MAAVNHHSVSINLLVLLLINGLFVSGQPRRLPAKKPKLTLTLTNPVSGIKVVFHDPAFINKPFEDSAWKKLTIHLPHQPELVTMQADAGSGYMINDIADQQWSPDGKYMTVWDTYGILNKEEFSGQRILFINLEDGVDTDFSTKKGSPVSTDNFRGWVKAKPHVVLKAARHPPGGLEEAYGPN